MKPKDDPKRPAKAGAADPKKRFGIQKLEDRIAPKKGGKGTHNCGASPSDSFGGSIY